MRPIYDEGCTFLGNDIVPIGWYAKGPEIGKSLTAEMIGKAMTPAAIDTIEEWLAELSVITARRAEDEFTGSLRIDAYSRRLAEYPADIAKSALFDGKWKFWPTWAELAERCDAAVANRKAMAHAINSKEQARAASMAEGEERKRCEPGVARKILESAGYAPKRFGGAE